MKKGIFTAIALIALISCANNSSANSTEKNTATVSKTSTASAIEVLYFHGKQRCVTCIAIGTKAEETIKELGSEKVVMKTVDYSTSEGEKIANQYKVASSSLLVVKDGKIENLTAHGFRYARNNPEQFKAKLKETIQNLL